MAEIIGQALIEVHPTTKGIQGELSSVLGGEADSAGKSAGDKLSSALGKAAKVGVAAIAGATTAITGFGAAAVKAGADFDTSMSQVAATMGMSTADLADSTSKASQDFQKLRDFAQEMGATTAFSATEAADALNYMALAGYDADTSMNMLPTVLNLAAAGSIDLASASDMVTDAQTALGLSLDETGTMVDQMAMAASKSNTSVEQLGDAFLKIGANARNIKGGTAELSTVLGVLADNGIKGTEAGTHLRNIMLAMNPTTDKAKAAWRELGISAYDAEGNMRNLPSVFEDLNRAMSGMTEQEKTATLSAMFNKTDLASINALLGTTRDRYDELALSIIDSKDAAGEMANVQLDNLQGDITLFQSALEGTKIAISDNLTPTLREFVQMGSDGLSQLTESFRSDGLAGAMDTLGTLLSDLVNKIAEMLPEMVNAGMDLLQSLIDGILDNIPQLIDSAIDIVMTLVNGILDNLPKIAEAAIEIIIRLAEGLIQALPELIPKCADIIVQMVDALLDNLDMIISCALDLIVALAQGLIDALPKLIDEGPVIIARLVEALISNTPKLITCAIQLIMALAEGLVEGIPRMVIQIPRIIAAIVSGLTNGIKDIVKVGGDLVDGLWNGIKNSWNRLIDKIENLASELVGSCKKIFKIGSPSKLFRDEVGKWIPEGIAVGIDANVGSVDEAMDNVQAHLTADAVVPSYKGVEVQKSGSTQIDISGIGKAVSDAVIEAMRGVGIYMDSIQVGKMVAPAVDSSLGVLSARRV